MQISRDWMLTPWRAAVHLPSRTAVVADVHLGYAQARCRAGDAVPAVSIRHALAPLQQLFDVHRVRRLVVAGDLFEERPSRELVDELLAWLRDVSVELVALVPGNHDRGVRALPELPVCVDGYPLGAWRVIHGDGQRPSGPVVQGHEHPLLRWGNGLTAPCYLVSPEHIVLPAFSADAAGVNVLHERRWSSHRCCAIAGEHVLDFGTLATIRPSGVARRTANR
jgi:uncharacterized protein